MLITSLGVLRDRPLFFEEDEEGNFQKKYFCIVKTAEKKIMQGELREKHWTCGFYYPGPVFDRKKKFLHKLQVRKKFIPEKTAQIPSLPRPPLEIPRGKQRYGEFLC